MNERLEIGGDLADEYREIQEQEAERTEAWEDTPVLELSDDDLDDWYRDWCQRNGHKDPIFD